MGDVVMTVRVNGALPWRGRNRWMTKRKRQSSGAEPRNGRDETHLEFHLRHHLPALALPHHLLRLPDHLGFSERVHNLHNVLDLPLPIEIDAQRVVLVRDRDESVRVGPLVVLLERELLLEGLDDLGSDRRRGRLGGDGVGESEGRGASEGEGGDEAELAGAGEGRGETGQQEAIADSPQMREKRLTSRPEVV